MNKSIIIILLAFMVISCSDSKLEKKGFSVSSSVEQEDSNKGLTKDSLSFRTRPKNVLLTANSEHRLMPLYKVNYTKKTKQAFIGSNAYHYRYSEDSNGNQWNDNLMPGFEAVYGYNMVNVAHYNIVTQAKDNFFEKPVLIKTLYYPAFSKDTLNFKPINRKFYMISVYDDDTNKDGLINVKDLRRLYLFDIEGKNRKHLIPNNYSVLSSEYDSANDYMYIFAKIDENKNGRRDEKEEVHIFWIDLNNPEKSGRSY